MNQVAFATSLQSSTVLNVQVLRFPPGDIVRKSSKRFETVISLREVEMLLEGSRLWTGLDSVSLRQCLACVLRDAPLHTIGVYVEKAMTTNTTFADDADVVMRIIFRVLADLGDICCLMVLPVAENAALRLRMDGCNAESTGDERCRNGDERSCGFW